MDISFDSITDLAILSPGAESIAISIDRGAAGPRGNKIYVNYGHPQQFTSKIANDYYIYSDPYELLQSGDMYWRTDAARAYQFRVQPAGFAWAEITGSTTSNIGSQIDFSGSVYRIAQIAADTTFTSVGHVPGASLEILIKNDESTTYSLEYPSAWIWVTNKPEDIVPGQRFLLSLKSFESSDEFVVADASASVYLESP